jgi:sugar transferase (PEP-CTERM/EpsH1 system associated)
MAIRVMHVVEAFGVGGGVENGIANLIEHTDPHRFEHVLCAVFHVGPQTDRYPADRVSLVNLEQKQSRARTQIGPLVRMIHQVKPDLVHSRNWGAIEGVLAARWARCRAIHSEHGVEADQSAEPWRRRWLRRAAYAAADRVFSVSHDLRDGVARRSGFAPHKIGVIHNGVDIRRFRQDARARQSFRAKLQIGDDEFVIGSVGRMNPVKDYPTLLRAAEMFCRTCPSWRLLLAGDGPERAELENAVAKSDALRGHVQFLGTTDRVAELLNALDVYVLSSILEGISNSLLEAMATGVPVIATATGGTPEVVVNGQSGLLVPARAPRELADSLIRVYQQPKERQRLGSAGRHRAKEEFSLDSMVRQYEEMYGKLATCGQDGIAKQETLCVAGKLKN